MTEPTYDFSDLRAIYINCTLKRSPEVSNTAGLKNAGGIPPHGSSRKAWDDGARFDHPFLANS